MDELKGEAWTAPGGGYAKVSLVSMGQIFNLEWSQHPDLYCHQQSTRNTFNRRRNQPRGEDMGDQVSRALDGPQGPRQLLLLTPLHHNHIWEKTETESGIKPMKVQLFISLMCWRRLRSQSESRSASSFVSSVRAAVGDALEYGPWPTSRIIYFIYCSPSEHPTPRLYLWLNVISTVRDH